MKTLRQAAQMALEAMKGFDYDKRMAAIEAVEQALAEMSQEIAAWYNGTTCDLYFNVEVFPDSYEEIPLYLAPPQRQWVGLTDEEILSIGKELGMKCRFGGNPNIDFDFANAIEEKLKEKNHDRT